MRVALYALRVAALTGLIACGSDPTRPTSAATAIFIDLSRLVLRVGESTQASALVYGSKGEILHDVTVRWTSTRPAVATVASNGTITAVAAGRTTIGAVAEP